MISTLLTDWCEIPKHFKAFKAKLFQSIKEQSFFYWTDYFPIPRNLCQVLFSSYSISCGIQKSYWESQNIDFGMSLSFWIVLTVFIINNKRDMLPAPSWKWESKAPEWVLVLYLVWSEWQLDADIYKWGIGLIYKQKRKRHTPCHILKMSANGESTTFAITSWLICMAIGCTHLYMTYRLPVLAKEKEASSWSNSENERRQSMNDFWSCQSDNWSQASTL